jgi:hypothetical protein
MKDTRIPTVKPGNPNTTGDLKHANQIEQNPYLPVILCIVLQNSEFFFIFFFFKEKEEISLITRITKLKSNRDKA